MKDKIDEKIVRKDNFEKYLKVSIERSLAMSLCKTHNQNIYVSDISIIF